MLSIDDLKKAQERLNELRSQVEDETALLELVRYLLLNVAKTNFAQLNKHLDELVLKFQLDEDFPVVLQTWYSTLSNEQKSALIFMLSSSFSSQ